MRAFSWWSDRRETMEKRDQASVSAGHGLATIWPLRRIVDSATINNRISPIFDVPLRRFIVLGSVGLALSVFPAFTPQARAAAAASDNPCNTSSAIANGLSTGTGFAAWTGV